LNLKKPLTEIGAAAGIRQCNKSVMISIVYLAVRSHTPIMDELMNAGIRVWEALSVSEVMHLCEHQNILE
jgi:hypothetical protein